MKKIMTLAIFLLLAMAQVVLAAEFEPVYLRVGLTEKSERVTISADKDCLLLISTDNQSNLIDLDKCELTITSDGLVCNGEIQSDALFHFAARRGFLCFNGAQYRGELIVSVNSSGLLTVVNYLSVEDYLRGVVPREMPALWNKEALKAQAIAARTYTYATMNRHNSSQYDLCATTHCQVYGGVKSENANTDQVIAETYGQVITYNNRLISAFYHSASGGATEDVSRVWGNEIHYLQSVSDWDQSSPRYLWTKEFTAAEIQNRINQKYPEIGNLLRIEQQIDSTQLVSECYLLIGDTATQKISAEKFRFLFGLYSSKMNIVTFYGEDLSVCFEWMGNSEPTINILSSELLLTVADDTISDIVGNSDLPLKKLVCVGGGWGHRVGMSQWGARGMADAGFTSEQIIMHYYQDVDITGIRTIFEQSGLVLFENQTSDNLTR